MPRFFVPPDQIRNDHFSLKGPEAYHAITVLRTQVGDTIELFDGGDSSYLGRVTSTETSELQGILIEKRKEAADLPFELILCPALIKAAKWDWLIEKACEIGVTRLIPLKAARSVVMIEKSDVENKLERWRRVALAASKQSGRTQVMRIDAPMGLEAILNGRGAGDLSLMPSEKEQKRTIREACQGHTAGTVHILVGPEGGWEMDELALAERLGAKTVRLGPTLLRSETASLVATSLVLGELGVY